MTVLKAPVPEVERKKITKNNSLMDLSIYKPMPVPQFRELVEKKKS